MSSEIKYPDYSDKIEVLISAAVPDNEQREALKICFEIAFADGYLAAQTDFNKRMGIEDGTTT